MLDVIIKALGELFEDPNQRPRPRQRQPRADGEGQMGGPSDPQGQTTLEDFMRQVLGGGAPEPEPQPPPQPKPARKPKAPRRDRKAERQAAKPVAMADSYRPAPAAMEVPVPAPESKQAVSPAAAVAAALHGNPQAAREAFIYSEIFGRPLGDR